MTSALSEPDCFLKFSAFLPDFQAWLARMSHDSSPVGDRLGLRQISHGADPRQWLEIGAGAGVAPIIPVFIHGGYWRALRAEDHRFVLPGLGRLGLGIANLEYRLMPAARMEDLVQDVVAGLHMAADHFPHARLVPVGHSAGAHLALAAAQADASLTARLAGVVAVSGMFDLSLVATSFLQAELRLTPAEIARFTIVEAPDCPVLFVVGAEETAPFRDQAEKLAATSARVSRVLVEPCHHMNILHACFTGTAPLVLLLESWLSGHPLPSKLKVPKP